MPISLCRSMCVSFTAGLGSNAPGKPWLIRSSWQPVCPERLRHVCLLSGLRHFVWHDDPSPVAFKQVFDMCINCVCVCVPWGDDMDGKTRKSPRERWLSCHFQSARHSIPEAMECARGDQGFAHKATCAQSHGAAPAYQGWTSEGEAKIVGRRMKKTGVRPQHSCPMREGFRPTICRKKTIVMVGLEGNPTNGSKI